MTLDELMALANEGYNTHGFPPDAILQLYENPQADIGDGLARFIVIELRETYSAEACTDEQLATAIEALEAAQRELQCTIDALANEDRKNRQPDRPTIKCTDCGITIPDVPEGATSDEKRCDRCNARHEQEENTDND